MADFRKLISFGKSSYVISLPKSWIDQNKLIKGSLISVSEDFKNNHNLVLSAKTSDEYIPENIEIDVSNLDPLIMRVLNNLYKKGYDKITIKYSKPEQFAVIQKMLNGAVIGFEIVRHEKNFCVIKSVAGAFDKEFDTILRRTFLVLKSMSKGITDSLEHRNLDELGNYRTLETTNNKYTGFCRRIINKHGFKETKKTTYMYCVAQELEKIADEYKYLCDYLLNNKNMIKKIDKSIVSLFVQLNDFVDQFYDFFYKFDLEKGAQIYAIRKKLISEADKFFRTKSAQDVRLLHYFINITQHIANMISLKIGMEL